MPQPTTLGGFKILRPAALLNLKVPAGGEDIPRIICNKLALEQVNIVFLAVDFDLPGLAASLAVQGDQAERVEPLLQSMAGLTSAGLATASILSLFPHRTRPEITGSLLGSFSKKGLEFSALAQSASAISAVLSEEITDLATEALFEPFSFGPYRTPSDWSLAQKGKERLYKEVVASYQEKRPKVYGLDWQRAQVLLRVDSGIKGVEALSSAFTSLSPAGAPLTFFISAPSPRMGTLRFTFALPEGADFQWLKKHLQGVPFRRQSGQTAVFVMNGPHFGDRYGIAGTLLDAFKAAGIRLLALACSVASISGVVADADVPAATAAISSVFEIPCITGA